MNIKELLENEELMEFVVEDVDDIPEDSEVTYEVWALCYDEDGDCVCSFLAEEFADPDAATSYVDHFTLEEFQRETPGMPPLYDFAFITLEVETVIGDPEDEDGGTMNIGTIYSRKLWLEEADPDPVVELTAADYTVLSDDNTLKVSCKLLKDFNKNDYVKIKFVDEPDAFILTYKIFSKVIDKDGDYYHLEFIG